MDAAAPLLAEVAVDAPGRDAYTYAVPDALADLAPGDCVAVPFGPRRERGFVLAVGRRPPPEGVRLKAILERRPARLPAHLLALIRWGARYYRCSLGEFLAGAVPAAVREGVEPERTRLVARVADFAGTLTARQRAVWSALPLEPTPIADTARAAATTTATIERLIAAGAATLATTEAIQEVRLEARDERFPLTDEQRAAVEAIATALGTRSQVPGPRSAATGPGAAREDSGPGTRGSGRPFLLHGVTGSGKTLVYLELAERVIASGRQVLLLLPEIALTPQLAARVRRRFARVAVWHSGFTEGERAEQWRRTARGEIDLVVGTRSALFAPLPAPGLVIVDEEHEHSYKQESVPRYHARDLAVVYAQQLGVPLVLGSATPSCETVHNARTGRYAVLTLKQRPLGGTLPEPLLVDMREECHAQRRIATVSRALIEGLKEVKARGEQAIVLLNRRGWSPVVSCLDCGHALGCASCDITLTYHKGAHQVRCHYCGHQEPLPSRCPACGQAALSTFGLGTEQLAQALAEAVMDLSVLRVDADTVAGRQGHAKLFASFAAGGADCLVGTQMVAKGLDFPRVTLVGVVAADRGLSVPDFRSAERTFQLIAQVAGRAGRGERPGRVVVQAFDTEAVPLRAALGRQQRTFYDQELALRAQYGYPPYAGLVRFLWSGEDQARVQLVATEHGQRLAAALDGITLLGPNPAGLAFLKGQHRWHALVKAPSRGHAQAFLDRLQAAGGLPARSGVRVAVDVDPYQTT